MEEIVGKTAKIMEKLKEVEEAMTEINDAKRSLIDLFETRLSVFDAHFAYPTKVVVSINRELGPTTIVRWLDYARKCGYGVDGLYRMEKRGRLVKVTVEALELDNAGVEVDVTLTYRDAWGEEVAVHESYEVCFSKSTKLGDLVMFAALVEEEDLDKLIEKAREEAREVGEVAERLREVMAALKLLL